MTTCKRHTERPDGGVETRCSYRTFSRLIRVLAAVLHTHSIIGGPGATSCSRAPQEVGSALHVAGRKKEGAAAVTEE